LVPARLARERQLLHPLRVRAWQQRGAKSQALFRGD
jgi:hypothetical protein